MKAYNLPKGKQWDLFHQIDGFNAIVPVLTKDGRWVIFESAVKYYEDFYLNASELTKQNSPIHDVDKLAIVQILVDKIRKFPEVDITEADQHPIQTVRQPDQPILEEKTLVENFLKEVLTDKYSATDTIAQALTKIEAKVKPIMESGIKKSFSAAVRSTAQSVILGVSESKIITRVRKSKFALWILKLIAFIKNLFR